MTGGLESPPRVDVGDLLLACRRAGSGPHLVLLHGAYQDSRFWHEQISDLSDEFTVITPDAPGFGASDDPPQTWTVADYGRCLARFSPVSVGKDLHARIPGSTLIVIPGAPHLANLEQPHAFNQAVRVFARRAARP